MSGMHHALSVYTVFMHETNTGRAKMLFQCDRFFCETAFFSGQLFNIDRFRHTLHYTTLQLSRAKSEAKKSGLLWVVSVKSKGKVHRRFTVRMFPRWNLLFLSRLPSTSATQKVLFLFPRSLLVLVAISDGVLIYVTNSRHAACGVIIRSEMNRFLRVKRTSVGTMVKWKWVKVCTWRNGFLLSYMSHLSVMSCSLSD